jgi:SNF2 family DNA or RNA helicase
VWGRVVVDEAHRIAEQSSQTSVAINRLCAPNRWALTGTPFKNGVSDLEALSRFLGIHPYASTRWWKANGDKQMELHRWRDLFMLTSDKNLLRLPAKQESVVHAVRGPGEQSLFETQEQHSNQLLQVGQQRLAANHPLLLFPWTAVERQLQGKTEGCVHCGEGAVKQCAADLHALCGTCVNPCASCVTARLKVDQVEGEWGMHSCKTRAVWECIRAARGTGVKVVLFSQWTSTLDIMAHVLTFYGVGYVQYDGRVNCVEERARRLQMFRDTPNIEVMLISLMAGGEGVNLAFATHVLLCEPYWHATAEMQAIDRLHRIGQTRITRVVRFITSSSIEAWVVSIQTRKCAQEAWMLGDGTPPRTPVISHGKGAIHSFLQGF